MSEIVLRVDVPSRMESEFRTALKRVVTCFIDELEYSAARELLTKSKLSPKHAEELASEAKEGGIGYSKEVFPFFLPVFFLLV
jgi:hypothetical protein